MWLWIIFPSFLPMLQSSCWLQIFTFCLRPVLPPVYGTWLQLSLSPLSASLCLIFLKYLAPTFPQHCSFVPGKKKVIIWGGSRNTVPKAMGWHPPSPDLYSYLVFNCIFFFPFLKHRAPPFLPDRKEHFISHSKCFPTDPYSSEAPEAPCYLLVFSHVGWSVGLAVVYYLFNLFFFPLSELRPELTTCCLFSSSLSLSSDRVFPKWIFFFFTNPVLFKETKRRIMWWFPPSERLWLCLSESFKSKAKPWLNTQTQLTKGYPCSSPPIGQGHNQRGIGRYLLISLVHWKNSIH